MRTSFQVILKKINPRRAGAARELKWDEPNENSPARPPLESVMAAKVQSPSRFLGALIRTSAQRTRRPAFGSLETLNLRPFDHSLVRRVLASSREHIRASEHTDRLWRLREIISCSSSLM